MNEDRNKATLRRANKESSLGEILSQPMFSRRQLPTPETLTATCGTLILSRPPRPARLRKKVAKHHWRASAKISETTWCTLTGSAQQFTKLITTTSSFTYVLQAPIIAKTPIVWITVVKGRKDGLQNGWQGRQGEEEK